MHESEVCAFTPFCAATELVLTYLEQEANLAVPAWASEPSERTGLDLLDELTEDSFVMLNGGQWPWLNA